MSKPEPQIIVSLFRKTLIEYIDAIDTLTALYDGGKMPDEALLHEHIMMVAKKREKLYLSVKGAKYHHGSDLGLVVPQLYLHGGIC